MLSREEFLRRIRKITVWKRGARRAPHKPLLLLYALGQVAKQRERLIPYETVDLRLRDLLARYDPANRSTDTHDPFSRLPRDELWEIPEIGPSPSGRAVARSRRGLKEARARGGFPRDQYALLRSDPGLVRQAAREILAGHFPRSLHDEILDAVGIGGGEAPPAPDRAEEGRPLRDPAFRNNVLEIYEFRCAVCGYDTKLGTQPLGLEAAHIMWHAAGGPDTASNGLALCTLHHKGLDLGAIGLRAGGGGYRVRVSRGVNGLSDAARSIRDLHGKPVHVPSREDDRPGREFIEWHDQVVFRQPSLDGGN